MGLISESTKILRALPGGEEIKDWGATPDGTKDAKCVPFRGTRQQAEAITSFLQEVKGVMAQIDALPPECKSMNFFVEGYADGDDREHTPAPALAAPVSGKVGSASWSDREDSERKMKIRIGLAASDAAHITRETMLDLASFLEPFFPIIMLPPDGNGGATHREGDRIIMTFNTPQEAQNQKSMLDLFAAGVPNNTLKITCQDNRVIVPQPLFQSIIENEEGQVQRPSR